MWFLGGRWVYKLVSGGRARERGVVKRREGGRLVVGGGGEKRSTNGVGKEVNWECEDVDCVGIMGGGMELGCG